MSHLSHYLIFKPFNTSPKKKSALEKSPEELEEREQGKRKKPKSSFFPPKFKKIKIQLGMGRKTETNCCKILKKKKKIQLACTVKMS